MDTGQTDRAALLIHNLFISFFHCLNYRFFSHRAETTNCTVSWDTLRRFNCFRFDLCLEIPVPRRFRFVVTLDYKELKLRRSPGKGKERNCIYWPVNSRKPFSSVNCSMDRRRMRITWKVHSSQGAYSAWMDGVNEVTDQDTCLSSSSSSSWAR